MCMESEVGTVGIARCFKTALLGSKRFFSKGSFVAHSSSGVIANWVSLRLQFCDGQALLLVAKRLLLRISGLRMTYG